MEGPNQVPKIPATCTGSKRVAGGSTLPSRASTISKTSTKSASNPTPSSFARVESLPPPQVVRARVVFEYTATSPYELSIDEDETVKVLEEDDGSGWVKVANSSGGKGLVPASYVEVVGLGEKGSNVTPRASGQFGGSIYPLTPPQPPGYSSCSRCPLTVRGVYDYQATGEDEIDVKEGRTIQLTAGPRGGQNYGDGWWEGRCFRCVQHLLASKAQPPSQPRSARNLMAMTGKLMSCRVRRPRSLSSGARFSRDEAFHIAHQI